MPYLVYLLLALNSFDGSASFTPETAGSIADSTKSSPLGSSAFMPGMDQFTFEDSVQNLYQSIGLKKYNMSYEVFRYGLIGYYTLRQQGRLSSKNLLSIIDFTKSSCEKRFYTIDLSQLKVIYNTYVSHGKNTGENLAKSFSNTVHSNQSSLGFYITGETYIGSKGYSLKLDGMESGVNDKLRERAVVMHDADYVSEDWISRYGRLGRSQGCPALPKAISKEIIDTIKNRTAIFAYYHDVNYLHTSNYLKLDSLFNQNELTAKLTR